MAARLDPFLPLPRFTSSASGLSGTSGHPLGLLPAPSPALFPPPLPGESRGWWPGGNRWHRHPLGMAPVKDTARPPRHPPPIAKTWPELRASSHRAGSASRWPGCSVMAGSERSDRGVSSAAVSHLSGVEWVLLAWAAGLGAARCPPCLKLVKLVE